MIATREETVLHARRWAEQGRLYALVDACDTPSLPEQVADAIARGGPDRAVSLYKGRAEESLSSIAPYLFTADASIFDWIITELWGTPWGCFVLADATAAELRTHFRKFLIVKNPDGGEWYFRFYDPRVMQQYLETATVDEAAEFFGPAKALAVTNQATYGVSVMTLEGAPVSD